MGIDNRRTVTRRTVVAAGLGALALLPSAAVADIVAKTGYKADGSAYEGLVSVEGKTYLYEGGVKFTGGQKEFRGSRYFHAADGRMAVSETVEVSGEWWHYDEGGLAYDGLFTESGKTYLFESGKLYHGGLKSRDGNLYYFDTGDGHMAVSEYVTVASDKYRFAADGKGVDGLFEDDGKTYLFEAGKMFRSGQKTVDGKQRYFHAADGHMAVSEDVKWDDGTTHHYDEQGVLADSTGLDHSSFTDGWYTLACKAGGVLDVAGADTADGSTIQVYEANGSQAQRWRVVWDKSVGAFRVETSAGVAEAGNLGFTDAGHRVALWQDLWVGGKGLANQRWKLTKDAEGYLTLTNADNGFVMTATSGKNGAKVTMEKATGADNQRWKATTTGSYSGWWTDSAGHHHVNNPDDGMMVRSCTRVDPVYKNGDGKNDGWGSIYDFDAEGTATWHLPTYSDLPNGGAHGPGAAVPNITQGDRRQRSILYALSRVGCPYRTGGRPNAFVCDGLTSWAVNKGADGDVPEGADDASYQWALIKELHGDPSGADISKLKPGDLVFWGDGSGKPLTYYAGAFGTYGYGDYHAGMYYANGKMINARSAGVTDQTVVADYAGEMGWAYLGGGDPYRYDTSAFGVPHM